MSPTCFFRRDVPLRYLRLIMVLLLHIYFFINYFACLLRMLRDPELKHFILTFWTNLKTGITETALKSVFDLITTGFLDFVHRPEFYKQENATFRKLDLSSTYLKLTEQFSECLLRRMSENLQIIYFLIFSSLKPKFYLFLLRSKSYFVHVKRLY
jgi:hypothetical protein